MASWFSRPVTGTRSRKASKPSLDQPAFSLGHPPGSTGIVAGHQVVEVGVDPFDRIPQDGHREGPQTGGAGRAAGRCDRPKK